MVRRGATVNINLTEEAHAGWQAAAQLAGANITTLIEVIGLHLAGDPASNLRMRAIGVEARALAQKRQQRR